ncbi:MarR family winged helix-turn-helix transcriptional regulator [Listeria booriae]|uniref:MarR family winged helix-turn-helix transcriptional regulator n=1 Tax=Listeria booriae TaxID=1552123 RepID=UPI001627F049|nr:MarR family transcriptional regulator [Listeria booriae]MBC2181724.1 winged helix DNA-binding protein [Listeria booriae]MBC2189695.1 winged helix DNA-binding protein [Listeria booriae]
MPTLQQTGDIIKAVVSINNALSQITKQHESELGVTFHQLAIINTIQFHQGGTLKQVIDQLSLSKSTASTQVDQLVTKGYIKREFSKKDRRETRLTLTTKGIELAQQSIEILPFYQTTQEQLATQSPETIEAITETLTQVLTQLQHLKGAKK